MTVPSGASESGAVYDLVIRNGILATPRGAVHADLAVRDGRIAALGLALGPAVEEVDASGLHVLPGLIDIHVHFREPGFTYKEDFGTGSCAAAVGGVTTVLEMPNNQTPIATAELFRQKLEAVGRRAHVDFGLYGIILQDNEAELEPMAAEGAIGFKLYMGETTGGNRCPDDGVIFAAFRRAAALGMFVGIHAENDPVLQRLKTETKAN